MKIEFDEHKAKGAACLLKQPIESFVKGAKWEFNKNVARDAKLREILKVAKWKDLSKETKAAFASFVDSELLKDYNDKKRVLDLDYYWNSNWRLPFALLLLLEKEEAKTKNE